MSGRRSVVVEADGGSRGNPGNAAYGAVLKDAATGEVIAERGERIGVATNNVAEYRGLIAGLELYRDHADGAELEVRMDSKLVVEQMSGRWKIKHPDMKPLAAAGPATSRLPGTTFTWVPRERNQHADRLANEALDGPEGRRATGRRGRPDDARGRRVPPGQQPQPDAAPPPVQHGSRAPTTWCSCGTARPTTPPPAAFSGQHGLRPGAQRPRTGAGRARPRTGWPRSWSTPR